MVPAMDPMKVKAVAIASLLLWDTRNETRLFELIDAWQYRTLLTDEEAKEVVKVVSSMPVFV